MSPIDCIEHGPEDWPYNCPGCFQTVAAHADEDWARAWLLEHRRTLADGPYLAAPN